MTGTQGTDFVQIVRERRRDGDGARAEGRLDEARQHYLAAVDACRSLGDAKLLAHTLRHLGDIEREMGRGDLAGPHLVEALEIARRENVAVLELANTIRPLAFLRDDPKLLEEANALYARANVPPGVAETARRLARHGNAEKWLRIAQEAADSGH